MPNTGYTKEYLLETLKKHKKLPVGDYIMFKDLIENHFKIKGEIYRLEQQLTKATSKIEDLEEENMGCGMQLAETKKPHCMKCGESSGHDFRGWMRLNKPTGDGDVLPRNKFYLCGSCILESEAVKDMKEFMLKNPQG